VSQRLRIPWILDLRDPWALDGWRSYPTRWHARRDLHLMQRALRGADVVIANTPSAATECAQLAPQARITAIPNGFDADDFPRAAPADPLGPMRIVHVGTLHDPMPERARRRVHWRQIDRTARSGRTLIEAVALLRERDRELGDRVRIELVGRVHPNHAELARACHVDDLVQTTGYVPHAIAVQRLARADACFVPLHGIAPGERALVVPGKLYEAVASGRPVLACLPPGDGADLVRATGAGLVFDPKDAEALARAIAILARAKRRGFAEHGADITTLHAFTRRAAARHLARTLDAARNPLLPVPQDDPWSMLRTTPAARPARRAA
jgi:glycosyltransferase involved in cell wall biosynthesis